MSWSAPGFGPISGKLKVIDISEKLTLVDLLVDEGETKGKTCKMILRLEGDTLHYCGTYNEARPTEFKSADENVYYAWKRTQGNPPNRPADGGRHGGYFRERWGSTWVAAVQRSAVFHAAVTGPIRVTGQRRPEATRLLLAVEAIEVLKK